MNVRALFENELQQRGLPFSIDTETDRYVVEIGEGRTFVSLENLQRDIAADSDLGRVPRFVDTIIASSCFSDDDVSAERLYWCLEPNDYEKKAEFRFAISDRVDRVLVHLSPDCRFVTWVTQAVLDSLELSESAATAQAFANLACALREATVESQDIDGVHLGFISTTLPFKSSLILAPNLREVAEALIGWPLLAVAPDRDFLYIWAARHTEFASRVGSVVVREYSQASYPISTEVYEITEQEVRALGEFPTRA